MRPLFRLLITLLLALSLPVQGIASTLRSCCEAANLARASVTAPAEHLAGVPHEHANHHPEPQADTATAQEIATDHEAAQHGCSSCASCCSAALATANTAPFTAQPPPSAWVSYQPPALSSHTPPIADPPPRSSRS